MMAVKTFQIIVPLRQYRAFNPEFTVDPYQTSILEHMEAVTRDANIIQTLLKENEKLRKTVMEEIESGDCDPTCLTPYFFQRLMKFQREKTLRKKKIYESDDLEIACYYLLSAGRKAYETLSKNLLFPSYSTVMRHLYDKRSKVEGYFEFEEFKLSNKQSGDVEYVWVSEDDTRIVEKLVYDSKRNTIVGLILSTDEQNGIPKIDSFEFTSIRALKIFIEAEKTASYAKLLIIKSLSTKSKPFILALYGTNGSDKATFVYRRWEFIKKSLAKIGIIVMGNLKRTLMLALMGLGYNNIY